MSSIIEYSYLAIVFFFFIFLFDFIELKVNTFFINLKIYSQNQFILDSKYTMLSLL